MAILQGFIKTIKRRLTNEGYKWQSEKTSSQTVVMGDGTDNTDTAEKRFGAIKGLTSSTSVTETGYALDATIGKKHEDSIAALNQSLSSIVFRSIVAKTSSGGDSFLLELDDAITSSSPLLIQFQSNSSNAQVEKYFITKPGKVRVILTESVVPGTWKFNVAYKK